MQQDKYVCGFLISFEFDRILLINKGKKLRGEMQVELDWCGIGGKIQAIGTIKDDYEYESPHQAMAREFKEETGYEIKTSRWHAFFVKEYKNTKIYFFCSFVSPDEISKVISASKDIGSPEGALGTHNMVDILFDPAFYTFDIPYLINMLMRESRRGFLPALDPEGINSANKKSS